MCNNKYQKLLSNWIIEIFVYNKWEYANACICVCAQAAAVAVAVAVASALGHALGDKQY